MILPFSILSHSLYVWALHQDDDAVLPVDAGDVDDHIDHVAAQLVRGHVHGAAVCGDVNLTKHIEQEGLLNAGILRKQTKPVIPRGKKRSLS